MMRLDDREWEPISISNLFFFIRGRENNMATLEDGDTPLISARSVNNGLKGFVNTPKKIVAGHCITLNNDGDGGAGLAYYQPADMALDTHVTALIPKVEMSMYTMFFISECLSKLHGFFGHGLSISNSRVKKIRIMLPVTDEGEPDYQFMNDYMSELMVKKKKQYRGYVKQRITALCAVTCDQQVDWKSMIDSHNWEPFQIDTIFNILPGKRLVAADSTPGDRPFIGALDNSNGVARFVSDKNESLDKNVLGVNYNGNGMVIGFYHPYECIFSDDVKRFHLKDRGDDPFVLLFMKTAILMQKQKFGYLYKFNADRMAHTSIMLPITDDGQPDYDFMEEFGRKMMLNKYSQYLSFFALSATTKKDI